MLNWWVWKNTIQLVCSPNWYCLGSLSLVSLVHQLSPRPKQRSTSTFTPEYRHGTSNSSFERCFPRGAQDNSQWLIIPQDVPRFASGLPWTSAPAAPHRPALTAWSVRPSRSPPVAVLGAPPGGEWWSVAMLNHLDVWSRGPLQRKRINIYLFI